MFIQPDRSDETPADTAARMRTSFRRSLIQLAAWTFVLLESLLRDSKGLTELTIVVVTVLGIRYVKVECAYTRAQRALKPSSRPKEPTTD